MSATNTTTIRECWNCHAEANEGEGCEACGATEARPEPLPLDETPKPCTYRVLDHVDLWIDHELTTNERLSAAEKAIEKGDAWRAAKARLVAATEAWREEKKALDADVDVAEREAAEASRAFHTGTEARLERCEKRADIPTQTIQIVRPNGVIHSSEPMTEKDQAKYCKQGDITDVTGGAVVKANGPVVTTSCDLTNKDVYEFSEVVLGRELTTLGRVTNLLADIAALEGCKAERVRAAIIAWIEDGRSDAHNRRWVAMLGGNSSEIPDGSNPSKSSSSSAEPERKAAKDERDASGWPVAWTKEKTWSVTMEKGELPFMLTGEDVHELYIVVSSGGAGIDRNVISNRIATRLPVQAISKGMALLEKKGLAKQLKRGVWVTTPPGSKPEPTPEPGRNDPLPTSDASRALAPKQSGPKTKADALLADAADVSVSFGAPS